MKNDKLEEILKNIGAEDVPADVLKIAEQTSRDFEKTLAPSKQSRIHILGDYIIKSRLFKLAAAAVIIIAVFVAFHQFNRSGVAFADIVQNIQNARTLTYQSFIQYTDQEPLFINTMVLEPYLMRVELSDGRVWILDFDQGGTLMLDSVKKEAITSSTAQITLDLYDTFKNFSELHNFKVSRIGQKEIDGIRALGFKLTRKDNGDLTIVWANPQTILPIRIESMVKDNDGKDIKVVTTNISFDMELDKSLFQFEIPGGYSDKFINGPQEQERASMGRLLSAKNMQNILLTCMTYAKDNHEQWPDSLQDLLRYGLVDEDFTNPSRPEQGMGYIYIKPTSPLSPSHVVLYEKYDVWGDGINVGFVDGHLEFMKEESLFRNRLEESSKSE